MNIKNTAIDTFCDKGMLFTLCALIFVLPVSIAYLDSFAGVTIFLYLLKRINRIVIDWPLTTLKFNLWGKINFFYKGFCPAVNFLNRPLQFLSLAVFISVLFSQYPSLSFFAFIGKFLKCVFLYFSFIEVFKNEKRVQIFVNILLASACITALNGIIQHYTGHDFLKKHAASGERINSSFFSANGLGAYLLPVIGLVVHSLYTSVLRHKSWLLGGLFATLLVILLSCLCWTYSRSSWIGFLIILFVMVLLDRRKSLFVGSLFLIFIFIFLPSLNNVRHLYLISDNTGISAQKTNSLFDLGALLEQGGSGRNCFWKKAVTIIQSSPIYGTGLNTYSRIIKRDPDPNTQWYAHNSYLQLTAETGILGLTSFLWLLFVLLSNGLDYCKRIKNPWSLTILQGTVAGLFGYLVQGFFDNTFYTVQLSVLLWMMIALMVAVTRLEPAL